MVPFLYWNNRKTSSISRTKSQDLKVSCLILQLSLPNPLNPISREWKCSWSSAERRCSNCIWVINKFIAYWGATFVRGSTVDLCCLLQSLVGGLAGAVGRSVRWIVGTAIVRGPGLVTTPLRRMRARPALGIRSRSEIAKMALVQVSTRLILCLCPAKERRRYKVTPFLIGWAQTQNQAC